MGMLNSGGVSPVASSIINVLPRVLEATSAQALPPQITLSGHPIRLVGTGPPKAISAICRSALYQT